MSPRLAFRRALTLLCVTGAVGLPTPSALAAPYQAKRTADYGLPISVDFRPKIWFHERPDYIVSMVDEAQRAIKECRLRQFNAMLDHLTEQRNNMQSQLTNLVSWVSAAKDLLLNAEQDLELYDHLRKDSYYEVTRREYEGNYQTTLKKIAELKDLVANGPARILFLRQDIQSLTTVINWLAATPHNCPEEEPLPPPAPPPRPEDMRDPNDPARPSDTCPTEVIAEINRARTDPQGYAQGWEGIDQDSLSYLGKLAPRSPMEASAPLFDAARRHAADTGAVDHTGSDGSRPMQRIHDAGLFSTITAEVIAKEQITPEDAIHQLITDMGNPTRPHRADLFNPNFTLVGVACALDRPHPVIVIDLSNPPMKRD